MEYRLLKEGEVLKPGDEYLLPDCITWAPVEALLGFEYRAQEFIAVRRQKPADRKHYD